MGILTMGIPERVVIELAKLNNATVFIETGTYQGGTTKWASRHFPQVHTIERAENIYHAHSAELSQIKGVTAHLGDSRDILPRILEDIEGQKAVHWLDGHWSGGETAGASDECPLLDELACLANRTEDMILIDDARLFLCAPPSPHDPAQWPTILDIVNILPSPPENPFVQIVDDVIFVIPNRDVLTECLVAYAQKRSKEFWTAFGKLHRPKK